MGELTDPRDRFTMGLMEIQKDINQLGAAFEATGNERVAQTLYDLEDRLHNMRLVEFPEMAAELSERTTPTM